jgi:uncharacterized protein
MHQVNEFSSDERMWAMFCHISVFAGFIIPFGNIIGPIIVWSLKKDQYPLVNDQGKEAINFQISMVIYFLASLLLILVLVGFALLIALFFFNIIIVVVAAIKANEGSYYRYPLCIRFIT